MKKGRVYVENIKWGIWCYVIRVMYLSGRVIVIKWFVVIIYKL